MSTTQQAIPAPPPPVPTPPERDFVKEAREWIRAGTTVPHAEEKKMIGGLKAKNRFDYARKLLEIWQVEPPAEPLFDEVKDEEDARTKLEARRVWLGQQRALCTYKDPDLPADARLDRAWKILAETDDPATSLLQETHGLAGSIHKRRWDLDGQASHLERSFRFYQKGRGQKDTRRWILADAGYTAINAAFVLDQLARQEDAEAAEAGSESAAAEARRAEAASIRQEIVRLLGSDDADPANRGSWWYAVTVAEAYFGLGEYERAAEWLAAASRAPAAPWEREATARQLAQLFLLRHRAPAADDDGREPRARAALGALLGGDVDAVRAAFRGKVGLALSGGGFRASLFHLGVLARLAEADLLRHVEVISCVSGGSIVGAHYYLALRRMLESTPDGEIGPERYVELVTEVARTFLEGVERNVRMRVLGKLSANLRMVVDADYSRTSRAGELYEEELYRRIDDTPRRTLDTLRVQPAGDATPFVPRERNWLRRNKVPVLALNATTLNTGHVWQFTASSMGEPPSPIDTDVDGNDWLRRMPHDQAPPRHRKRVPLGHAVGASACVPGLFEPLSLPGLYPGRTVRLVDGGVHDNQGVATLLDNDCTVIVVSDASGQMNSVAAPSAAGLLPVLRTNTILQARVRQAQHRELAALRAASRLRGLAFLHLQRDVGIEAVDWEECPEPATVFGDARAPKEMTEYGIPTAVQRLLAGIRTDLDSFHRAEAYALMTSGYHMAVRYLPDAFGGDAEVPGRDWFFDVRSRLATAGDRIPELLGIGSSMAFKAWRVRPAPAWAFTLLLAAIGLAGLFGLAAWASPAVLAWAGWGVAALLGLALASFVLMQIRPTYGVGRVMGFLPGLAFALLAWPMAWIYLAVFDRLYVRGGRLNLPDPHLPPPPS